MGKRMANFSSRGHNLRKMASVVVLVFSTALAASYSAAQDVTPDRLLKALTADVMFIIRQDEDAQTRNPARVVDLVEARLLPLFNFNRMTQIALMRNWRVATAEQQDALVLEFRQLVVRNYVASMSGYRDRVIEFKPLHSAPDDPDVTIRYLVTQSGTASITMSYDMEKTAAGWKVYDIKIDGISQISNYREAFASKVREGGVEYLITSLAEQNRHSDVRIRSIQLEHLYFMAIVRRILEAGR